MRGWEYEGQGYEEPGYEGRGYEGRRVWDSPGGGGLVTGQEHASVTGQEHASATGGAKRRESKQQEGLRK